jgi:hypothetical protein
MIYPSQGKGLQDPSPCQQQNLFYMYQNDSREDVIKVNEPAVPQPGFEPEVISLNPFAAVE